MSELQGVFPILPTIFHADGSVDETGTSNVFEYLLGAGAAGVVFPGLASEYDMLTPEERLHLTACIGRWNEGRVPVIVGASAGSLDQAVAYARAGADIGAAAAMVLTPHAHAGDPTAMAAFFNDLHARSGVAIMLQNAPAPMGIGLGVDEVVSLAARVPGIAYVKEETMPSGHRITALGQRTAGSVRAVFGGAGARYVLDELARGAVGTMPACEITEVHVAMLAAWAAGDRESARTLFERTLPLLSMQAIFRWRLTKAVLKRRGLIASDHVRAPGPALDREDQRELDILLNRIADLVPMDSAPGRTRKPSA
ncbi:dihydrodipicolinate synthase family protein [Pseudoxanthomonas sp.]|uniref:dihydrodipicolinate synthase family protein n=1 Tax=Pseudoxanthomonas sp. TaxID=1871049 RepID=UPI002607A30E|nr:dihydrodipicolinate synthase family protein [Pseudoxanthomonas sp.]WDS37792.1 MAG: dihydrodipicolinate synthase family protein [Pseudoxanthomonas sp.]